jgi:hypothetical protein
VNDWFTLQFDTDRALLPQTIGEIRAAVAAANQDYPDQYLVDAQEAAERTSQLEADRQRRRNADQAVIDEAMRVPVDER